MLSPSTSALGAPPRNFSPIRKACARPSGLGLHRVLQVEAPALAVAQQLLEARRVLRRADDQDLADAGQHQHAERVVDHRLVVDRHQLLADRQRGRMQPGAGASGEDDAFAVQADSLAVAVRREDFVEHAAHAGLPVRQVHAEASRAACACRGASSTAAARASDRRWSGSARSASARQRQRHAARARASRSRGARSRASSSRRRPPRGRCRPARAARARRAAISAVRSASRSAPVGAPTWSSMTFSSVALVGQPQHRLGEVAAARRVDPAGAQDQVPAAAGADLRSRLRAWCGRRPTAGRWARPRRAAGRRCRRRRSRCCSAPARRRSAAAAARQHAGRVGVDRLRQRGLGLGLVDRGVRGGVDDQVGLDGGDRGGERVGLREVGGAARGSGSRARRTSPSGCSERCSSQPTWPSQPSSRIFMRQAFAYCVRDPVAVGAALHALRPTRRWRGTTRTVLRRPVSKVSFGCQPSSRSSLVASIA